jgi:hypothetical protein
VLTDVTNYALRSRKQVGQLHRKIKKESDQLDTKIIFYMGKGTVT